eukprot:scaffold31189_cov58-Phaeocystis_antarctica.AAC.1
MRLLDDQTKGVTMSTSSSTATGTRSKALLRPFPLALASVPHTEERTRTRSCSAPSYSSVTSSAITSRSRCCFSSTPWAARTPPPVLV